MEKELEPIPTTTTVNFNGLQEIFTCIHYPFFQKPDCAFVTKYQLKLHPEHPGGISFIMRVRIIEKGHKLQLAHFVYAILFVVKELPELLEKSEDKKMPAYLRSEIEHLALGLMRGILYTKLLTSCYNPLIPPVLCDSSSYEEIITDDNVVTGIQGFYEPYEEIIS